MTARQHTPLPTLPTTRSKGQRWGGGNIFYASCEQVSRPDLLGKPVVVLSNNDGGIMARSAEVRKPGIPTGEVYFKIQGFLKARNVAVFSSNFALYGDLSARVMGTLEEICPVVQQYSIEAFIPMRAALAINTEDIAATFKDAVYRWAYLCPSA